MKKNRLLFIGILCIFICIGSVKAKIQTVDEVPTCRVYFSHKNSILYYGNNKVGGSGQVYTLDSYDGKTCNIPSNVYADKGKGYKFLGWYDKTLSNKIEKVKVDSSAQSAQYVYAKFASTKCTVIYNANGGNSAADLKSITYSGSYNTGTCSITNPPTAEKEGYIFGGWGKSKYCISGVNTVAIGKQTVLYACLYKKVTLTTKYETENGVKTKNYLDNLSISKDITNKNVDVPREFTKNGYKYVFQGWKRVSGSVDSVDLNKSTWNNIYFRSNAIIEAIFSKTKIKEDNNQPAPPADEPSLTPVTPSPTPENPSPTEEYTIVKVTKPTISEMYYINYDLDGGKFIDGTTTISEVVKLNKFIGALKTNPIKEGYKFSKWVLKNGETVDFDKTPNDYKSLMENNVLNLKAIWTKIDSTEKYICPTDYPIFEPTSGYCYKVLKADDTTPDLEASDTSKTYNWTREIYPAGSRYCWNYFTGKCASGVTNDSTCSPYNHKIFVEKGNTYSTYEDALNAAINCKGSYQLVSGSVKTGNGKNNATYEGYTDQDWWVSENTCKFETACTEASDSRNTEPCYKEYKAIIYDLKVADLVEEETEEENVVPITDDEINDTSENKKDKTAEEVTINSKTGDTLFIIALIAGIGALGYSAYYFINEYREKKISD